MVVISMADYARLEAASMPPPAQVPFVSLFEAFSRGPDAGSIEFEVIREPGSVARARAVLSTEGWLIDTNVVSELRHRGRADPAVRAWASAVDVKRCWISVLTLAEIGFGVERARTAEVRVMLKQWLDQTVRADFEGRIIPVSEAVLVTWRRLALAGQRAGQSYSPPDALLAATALVHGLTVVTRNTSDFERSGVALINPWMPPRSQ